MKETRNQLHHPALIGKEDLPKIVAPLSTRTWDNLIAAGAIPVIRVGRRTLFDPPAVTAAIRSGVTTSPEAIASN